MNIRAKCINRDCKAYNIERSVAVGTVVGFGARNGRLKCPGRFARILDRYNGRRSVSLVKEFEQAKDAVAVGASRVSLRVRYEVC